MCFIISHSPAFFSNCDAFNESNLEWKKHHPMGRYISVMSHFPKGDHSLSYINNDWTGPTAKGRGAEWVQCYFVVVVVSFFFGGDPCYL